MLFNYTIAQIDTTIWYPLQIGNIWQYNYAINVSESYGLTIEVTSDTTINEKVFYKIRYEDKYIFQRVENNNKVWEYNILTNQEYVRYDFVSPDKSVWNLDSINGQYGIYETFPDYISIYGDSLISKVYNSAYIDTNSSKKDTSWSPMVDGMAIIITKGLGITEYGQGINWGSFVGARINGYKIGEITNISESIISNTSIILNQNYPNPFNPQTTIEYTLSNAGNVSLKVFDILGREVATLVNEFQNAGTHHSTLSALHYNLSSGIYFYRLQSGSYSSTKKLMLIK